MRCENCKHCNRKLNKNLTGIYRQFCFLDCYTEYTQKRDKRPKYKQVKE